MSEAMAKLERLNMRSAELDEELEETENAISECEKAINSQNNSTKEEVLRLKSTFWWFLSHLAHTKPTLYAPARQTRGDTGSSHVEGDKS